ncbi:MAG TPA: methyl-accepting chemotaxis protein [Clostridiaceae bacterium]
MKIRKKVKLIHGTLALILVSFMALAVVGIISFTSSSKLNNYYTSLSTDSVVIIENYGDLGGTYNELRNYVTKVIDRTYTDAQVNDVNTADAKIKAIFTKIKSSNLDSKELASVQKMNTEYTDYMSIYKDIEAKRKEGLVISSDQAKEIATVGAPITTGINSLITYEKSQIATEREIYNSVFQRSTAAFIIVVVLAALLLLAISSIFVRELRLLLKEMITTIKVIASGDFTYPIDTSSNTEFGNMNKQLDTMQNSLSGLLKNITTVASTVGEESSTLSALSEEMSASSLEVAGAIHDVATGSTAQASELMSVYKAMKEFDDDLETFVTITGDVNITAGGIGSLASTSNGQLQGLIAALNNISKSFDGVIEKIKQLEGSINQANDITGLINSISEQTNLLALNAAIEAARAGEAGRGFSVVADEIRKLAEQSKNSSDTISGLLSNVSAETSNLVKVTGNVSNELSNEVTTINTALNSFKAIVASVETILPDIQKVSVGINKLNKDMVPVILKIESTSAVAEENSASAEEIAASTEEMKNSSNSVASTAQNLTGSAIQLTEKLNKFKL